MVKNIVLALVLLLSLGISSSQFDKKVTVLNQSRSDKVVEIFKEMMRAYEEEDLSGFFSYVSEDRFVQDYMTFYDAIDKDMRVYDILNVDTWIDKITEDGVKRYLYVTWDKRYQSTTSNNELSKKGYSRFLFDEVNGKYKLIGLAGNNFWGGSLSEWTRDMPEIAGQVNRLPDFTIANASTSSFDIKNIGTADYIGDIQWKVSCGGSTVASGTYNGGLSVNSSIAINFSLGQCYSAPTISVDPNNLVRESNENNNQTSLAF